MTRQASVRFGHVVFKILLSSILIESLGQVPSINWTISSQTIPSIRYGCQTAIYNDTLFVIGGNDVTSILYVDLSHLQVSDSSLNDSSHWSEMSWPDDDDFGSITELRDSSSSTQIDNLLYIVAPGYRTNLGLMYIYNLDSKQPIEGSSYAYSMPVSVSWTCAVHNVTHIFATGGEDVAGTAFQSLQIYNIQDDSWSEGPEMNLARTYHMCAYSNFNNSRKVYVFGGRTNTNPSTTSVEYYDILEGVWKNLTRANQVLSVGRHDGSTLVYNQYIFIIGGSNFTVSYDTIDVFDVVSETMISTEKIVALGLKYPVLEQEFAIIKHNINGSKQSYGYGARATVLYTIGGYHSPNTIRLGYFYFSNSTFFISQNVTNSPTASTKTSSSSLTPTVQPIVENVDVTSTSARDISTTLQESHAPLGSPTLHTTFSSVETSNFSESFGSNCSNNGSDTTSSGSTNDHDKTNAQEVVEIAALMLFLIVLCSCVAVIVYFIRFNKHKVAKTIKRANSDPGASENVGSPKAAGCEPDNINATPFYMHPRLRLFGSTSGPAVSENVDKNFAQKGDISNLDLSRSSHAYSVAEKPGVLQMQAIASETGTVKADPKRAMDYGGEQPLGEDDVLEVGDDEAGVPADPPPLGLRYVSYEDSTDTPVASEARVSEAVIQNDTERSDRLSFRDISMNSIFHEVNVSMSDLKLSRQPSNQSNS